MAGRGDRLLKKFAEALALGIAPVQAAELAGYPRGKSEKTYAANARRRARHKRVLKMVDELQKPAKEKLAREIEANFAWATEKLMSIASAKLDLWNIKASDRIRAIEVLAKMHGWNASEKTNSGESKIERIEWVIVEPKNRDGDVPPLLAKARYRGAFGGRDSGKSRFFFARLVIEEYLSEPGSIVVCIRGTQRTLATLLNVKRTWRFAPHMSAFDPKRTLPA